MAHNNFELLIVYFYRQSCFHLIFILNQNLRYILPLPRRLELRRRSNIVEKWTTPRIVATFSYAIFRPSALSPIHNGMNRSNPGIKSKWSEKRKHTNVFFSFGKKCKVLFRNGLSNIAENSTLDRSNLMLFKQFESIINQLYSVVGDGGGGDGIKQQ